MSDTSIPQKSQLEMINWLHAVVLQKAKELNCYVLFSSYYYPTIDNMIHIMYDPKVIKCSIWVDLNDDDYEIQIKDIAADIMALKI